MTHLSDLQLGPYLPSCDIQITHRFLNTSNHRNTITIYIHRLG